MSVARTIGPLSLNSPRGCVLQRPTLVRNEAPLPSPRRQNLMVAAGNRAKPKLDFLPIRLAVADKAKYAAALALLTPLLLPFAASVGTNSHLLQSSSPWLAVCVGSVAFHLAAPHALQQPHRRVSAKNAASGEFAPADVPAQQNDISLHRAAEAATPAPQAPLAAHAIKTPKEAQEAVTPVGAKPDAKQVSFVEEWRGPDADEGGRGYAAKWNVLPSRSKVPLAAYASTASTDTKLAEKPAVLETGNKEAPMKAAEIAAEPLAPVLAAAIQTPKEVAEKEGSQAVSLLAAETKGQGGEFGDIVPMKLPSEDSNEGGRLTVGDLQRQHDARMASLKEADQFASVVATRGGGGTAVAVAEPALDQAAVKAQEYEAKLSNLKQTAQKKEKEESKRWEARLSVVQQIYASVQGKRERIIAAKPSDALVKITQPVRQLAKLSPKAMLSNLMAAFAAAWSWLEGSFSRFGGGNRPSPSPQA